MWLNHPAVGASLFMMLISSLEAKPHTVDISGISNADLIKALLAPGDDACKCVPIKNCCGLPPAPNNVNNIPDICFNDEDIPILQSFVDERNGMIIEKSQDSPCKDILSVCCNKVCKKTAVPTSTPGPVTSNECGIRNTNGVGVRVNGFENKQSQLGEFPWMVAILAQDNTYVAGGSLVHPRVVLTAAHKVYDYEKDMGKEANTLVARIGDWDLSTTNEPFPNQNINVERRLYQPGFDRAIMVNNSALLILKKKATLSDTVMPICLPEPGQVFGEPNCIVAGWGKDAFGATGKYQKIMKAVNVNMVEHSKCESQLKNTHLTENFTLHKSFVCAGDQGEDSCTGDGGSPLVCSQNGKYVQVGITAWGIGCAVPGRAGVYSNVPEAIEWIQDKLNNNIMNNEQEVGKIADVRFLDG